jgi:hypothetical protein
MDRSQIEESGVTMKFLYYFPPLARDINPIESIVDLMMNLQRDEIDNQKGDYDRDSHYTKRHLEVFDY